jgi:ribosomal protein L32
MTVNGYDVIYLIGGCVVGFPILLLCAWFASRIYNKRGRSTLAGFVMGFVLGPVGILLARLIPKNKTELARRRRERRVELLQSGMAKECPHCRTLIRANATVCARCGRDVVREFHE